MKINKKLILMLILVLIVGVLGGCDDNLPDGIESKRFNKDMDSLLMVVVKSLSTKTYKEKDISKIIDKMNEKDYMDNLNNYEISIINTINDILPDIKKELSTGNHTIKSQTYERIKWIIDVFDD